MKAISIKNPWAFEIITGEKEIEYRTWKTDFLGDLLICASSSPKIPKLYSGHALGVVEVFDYSFNKKEKVWEWHLRNPRPLKKPFLVKGKLRIYDVPVKASQIANEFDFAVLYSDIDDYEGGSIELDFKEMDLPPLEEFGIPYVHNFAEWEREMVASGDMKRVNITIKNSPFANYRCQSALKTDPG